MAVRLSPFEEFIALFNNLREAAKDSPERVQILYNESDSIRRALQRILIKN